MSDNTIFDDVFRTMMEKMTFLVVPLINDVFHTSYPADVEIVQLRNEYQRVDGEIITDSRLLIGNRIYHIECQSTDDTTMAVRMIEYDFATAVEFAEKKGRRYRLEFTRSCVLYLRSGSNTPDFLEVDVVFPDGESHLYSVPTIKVNNYTKDNIFEKNLLMLLPFYIMRYEKRGHEMSEDPQLFQELLNEYEVIRSKLEVEITETGRSELFSDLIGLITRISDYIFRNEEEVRKGIGEVMGGHVLELESEKRARLLAEAKEQAAALGREQGMALGREQGMALGREQGMALGIEQGMAQGMTQGITQGEERLGVLINRLIFDGRSDEIQKVVTDKETREAMYREYQL